MGKRGQKFCGNPDCGKPTGPRTLTCKYCGFDFCVKKGASKIKKKKNGVKVNWKEDVFPGDYIRVISGSGPYFPLKDGYEPFGYSGYFLVKFKKADGLLCYPADTKGGASFIYMGPEKESSVGSVLRPHRIRKVDPNVITRKLKK